VVSAESELAPSSFRAVGGKTYWFVVDSWRGRASEARGYYVNPPGTFEVEFTFTTLELVAELTTPPDGPPVLNAWFSGGSLPAEQSLLGAGYGFVHLDRSCGTWPVSANEPDGRLTWPSPPPGWFLITATVTNSTGEPVIVKPVVVRVPPPNDDLAQAEVLSGYEFTHVSSIAASSREHGEPAHGRNGLGSIWWQWTAPASGWVDLTLTIYGHRSGFEPGTPGTDLLPDMAVYRFRNGKLQRVAGAKRKSFKATSRYQAERDVTYLIAGQIPRGYWLSDCSGPAEISLQLGAARMAAQLAGQTFLHRTPIALAIEPNFPLAEIERVDYFERDPSSQSRSFLTRTNQSPFIATWFGAGKGTHEIVARVYRKDGASFETESVKFFVQTANDDFADAMVLVGDAPVIQDDVGYATREPGEPRETGSRFGDSVWYRWTAPSSGRYLVRFIGFGEGVYFYTGSSVSRLQSVAAQHNDGATLYWFDAIAGITYHIAVKRNIAWPVAFELSILPGEPPGNDSFSNAAPIAHDATLVPGTLRFGTVEPSEPGGQIDSSVWYAWTAPADGVVAFKPPWPIMGLQLYAGSTLPLLEPLEDLTDPRDYQWRAPWRCYRVRAQQTYHLQVFGRLGYGPNHDPYWDLNANRFNIEMQFAEPPGNDSFRNPFELPSGSTMFVGESLGASSESADVMNGLSTAVTLWWTWKAPADGILTVTFSNMYVSLFRGDTLETLQPVTGSLNGSVASIPGNETFRVCAFHWYQYVGPFGFQLDFQESPAAAQTPNASLSFSLSTSDASPRRVIGGEANPWTLSATLLSSEAMEFLVMGEPGRRFVLELSFDLRTWETVQSSAFTVLTSGRVRLTVPREPDRARFFRVRVME
jgi:hypothetical protein